LLNCGESKVRMLIIPASCGRSRMGGLAGFFQSGVRPTFKIAPRLPRTSGDESQSQWRGFDLSLPQWVRGLCLDYDSVREASAQVRLRTNTGDRPQPVGGAHPESRARAGRHQGADSWAVPPSMALRRGCSESCPAYVRHLREPCEELHRAWTRCVAA
jgi:hypothetical protein